MNHAQLQRATEAAREIRRLEAQLNMMEQLQARNLSFIADTVRSEPREPVVELRLALEDGLLLDSDVIAAALCRQHGMVTSQLIHARTEFEAL